jgi:ABC-2 type transport system ATP-binding protein
MIIDHGKLLFDGALDVLRERFGGNRQVVVDFAETYDCVDIDGAQVIERSDRRAAYEFPRGGITASELIQRLSARYRLRDLEVREPEIEATIRRIYEEKLLEAG